MEIVLLNTPPGDLVMLYFVCKDTRRKLLSPTNYKYWINRWGVKEITKSTFPLLVRAIDIQHDHYRSPVVDLYLRGMIMRSIKKKDIDTALSCLRLGCYTVLATITGQPRHTRTYKLLMMDDYRSGHKEGHHTIPFTSGENRVVKVYPYDVLMLAREEPSRAKMFTKKEYSTLFQEAIRLAAKLGDITTMITFIKVCGNSYDHHMEAMIFYGRTEMIKAVIEEYPMTFGGGLLDVATKMINSKELDMSTLVAVTSGMGEQSKMKCMKLLVDKGEYRLGLEFSSLMGIFRKCFGYVCSVSVEWGRKVFNEGWGDQLSVEEFNGILRDSIQGGYWGVVEAVCRHPLCSLTSLVTIVEHESSPKSMQEQCALVLVGRLMERLRKGDDQGSEERLQWK